MPLPPTEPPPGSAPRGSDEEPDPRFTLANERTLLAWNRTALALIGGGLAIGHLIEFHSTLARILAAMVPLVLGVAVAVLSQRRWLRVQQALRDGTPLPLAPSGLLVAGAVLLAVAVAIATIVDAAAG